MGKASRDKGASGEREVATIFRSHGFTCQRTPNSGGLMFKGDLIWENIEASGARGATPTRLSTFPRIHVEVKRSERWDVPAYIRQAELDAEGKPWLVAMRRNRTPWYAVVPLEWLVQLLAKEGT